MSRSDKSDRTLTCPSCLTPYLGSESFCSRCGAPIGPMTNLDPIKAIQTEGFLFRKALEGRPKPIVLLGVWILHLPVLVIGVATAVYMWLNLRSLSELVFVFALAGLSYYAFVVLYRITKNYLTANRKK